MISRTGLQNLRDKVINKPAVATISASVKRATQPAFQDYKTASEILQGAIKRKQLEPVYSKLKQASRKNISLEQLKELSKPFYLKDLRNAWRKALYELTLYAKPLSKLNKAELYHELLNVNHNFSSLPIKSRKKA